ncbi:hypothetical protein [Haladaptatus sp. DFWS20]|uniref:hypothetical protein n=1 Tax=Haladaptatus sp. DFWS20 TaxID=3403467 RepID=UPI003EB8FD35
MELSRDEETPGNRTQTTSGVKGIETIKDRVTASTFSVLGRIAEKRGANEMARHNFERSAVYQAEQNRADEA